ncbi:MAG: hypothetical protein WCE82_11660 [Halobacteriota archaeon]
MVVRLLAWFFGMLAAVFPFATGVLTTSAEYNHILADLAVLSLLVMVLVFIATEVYENRKEMKAKGP